MRVLIVNTSEKRGGAAVAANRLMEALNNNGVKAKMLVRDKDTNTVTVATLPPSPMLKWNWLWERWCVFFHLRFSRQHLFEIDLANTGTDITGLREFKEADIIHLHWINQGMLSLKGIRRILDSGKPVVWTMHDLWPLSSICHYAHGCPKFQTGCHHCQLLPDGGSERDLSTRIWKRKSKAWQTGRISFVTCSRWLGEQARQSGLQKEHTVTSIPNPIDTNVFCRQDPRKARMRLDLPLDKQLVLFVSQRVTDHRKGMDYFIKAIDSLVQAYPIIKEKVGIAILGGHSEEFEGQLPLPVYPLGYVSDEKRIIDVYNAVDLYVLPSLEDNLPNTIMEAMACGKPCVGFDIGGIPEMIDHQVNGYVAEYKDADDLARGIHWVLDEANQEELSRQAVRKVMSNYSQQRVAKKYIEVYQEAIASQKNNGK